MTTWTMGPNWLAGYEKLRKKGCCYWVFAGLLILVGTYVGDWLGKSDRWVDWRYKIYELQTRRIRPQPYVQATVIVLIDDDEYWLGDLGRRAPIKRDYLARLLRAVDSADPAVIALDFDLRSPTPDGQIIEHADYRCETKQLLGAIRDVSLRRSVVLPKTVGGGIGGVYQLESDIYDGFDFNGGRVKRGYIALPYDLRTIAPPLELSTGGHLDSLSLAMVRAFNENALRELGSDYSVSFGSFVSPDLFDKVSARSVLIGEPEALAKMAHRIVIVGGAWNRLAYKRGGLIDAYLTPAGRIPGAFIHANFVEAILGQRYYSPLKKYLAVTIEIFLSALVAILFALDINVSWKVAAVLSVWGILVLCSYTFLQNLGLFFDFFVPSILVGLHAGFERIREWRGAYIAQGGV